MLPSLRPNARLTSAYRKCMSARFVATRADFKARLDVRRMAEDPARLAQNLATRNVHNVDASLLAGEYERSRALKLELNEWRAKRNELSKLAAKQRAGGQGQEDADRAMKADAASVKRRVQELESRLNEAESALALMAERVPNDTHPDVPTGAEENARQIAVHGSPAAFAFPARDHVELGKLRGIIDVEAASVVSGHAHYYLLGTGALLEQALVNYAMSICLKHGYHPVHPPSMVREEVVKSCGFQPRADDAGQIYRASAAGASSDDSIGGLYLAATAEIPMAGLVAGRTLEAGQAVTSGGNGGNLPMDADGVVRLVGVGRSYRAEAGSRGRDTRGIYRVHEFTKVEMFVAAPPAHSERLHEEIRAIQTAILRGLGLCFRVLDMPSEELGASAYRKYDMEAWMPGRGGWGEVSSASNCTDYQARRLGLQCRMRGNVEYAHTLNGTACAVPRTIVALMEQGQREDGSVAVPEVLLPWMHGREVL